MSAQAVDGFHPFQAISLKKALHHLQRVHLANRNEEYGTQISDVLVQVQGLHEVVRKNTQFSHTTSQYSGVEKIFVTLQIISASMVAFAHGANDVANAIGPVAAVMGVLKTNSVGTHADIPPGF